MKLIKLAIKLLVILVVLSALAVVGLLMTFNPNDYKPQIIQAVKDQTGRTLTMDGDIGLSFFPRLGFSVGHTELSNADGFQARVFAEVDEIDVGLQIRPLFMGKVELDQLVLNGMVANLEINTDGSTNWDDLANAGETSESQPAAASEAATTEVAGNTELPPIRFQGIRIADAQVSCTDKVGGTSAIMENFNFSTGVVELWEPIDFKGDFRVENKYPQLDAKLNYSGTLIAKVLENQFALKNFKLALDAAGEPIPNGKIAVNIGADISANTATEVAEIEQLSIQFDETTISGKAKVNNFTTPAVQFAVNIDQLNADRYIPQSEPAVEAETADPVEVASTTPVDVNADTLIELPMQTLRDLNMDGEFTVGKFQVMSLKTQNFKAVLSAHKGIISLKPLGIEMYEGVFDGAVKIDARKDIPAYTVQAKLSDMQVNPLMVDFAEFDVVEGAGAFDLNITTQGDRVSQLKRGLNGTMSAVFADGVIKANLLGELGELLALFGQDKAAAKVAGGKTTPFNSLKLSGSVVDGKVTTKDLNVDAGDAQITGGGSFDIPTEYVDMALNVSQDGKGCTIPLKGKLAEIDYAKFAKGAVPGCIKDAGKALLNAEKEKLKAKLDAEKDKLKAELKAREAEEKAKLKAKLEAEKKKAEEKLKNKLKDQLKGLF